MQIETVADILGYVLVDGSGGYPKNAGAMSRVGIITARNPTHQAPTQRGSSCCRVILQQQQQQQQSVACK